MWSVLFLVSTALAAPAAEGAEPALITMAPAAELAIHVESNGRAVVGAIIRAVPLADASPGPDRIPRTADAASSCPASTWAAAPQWVTSDSGGVAHLMTGGARLRVRISAAGLPAAAFMLDPRRDGPARTASALSAVTVVLTPGGPAQVRVLDAEGRWRGGTLPADISSASSADLSLVPAAEVAGQVVDASSGRPVSGALAWSAGDPEALVRGDRLGRFLLRSRLAALDRIWVEAPGYLGSPAMVPRRDRRQGQIGAEASGTPRLRVALAPASEAAGVVVDRSGRAITGACVTLHGWSTDGADPPLHSLTGASVTGAGGRFRLRWASSERFNLEVFAPGFAPTVARGLTLSPVAGVTELGTLVLDPEARIEGRVIDPEGRPIARASVLASADATNSPPAVVTGPDGRFELEHLRAGSPLHLEVGHPGYLSAEVGGVAVPGPPVAVLLRRGARVAGQVLDDGGAPIHGAVVLVTERCGNGTQAPGARTGRRLAGGRADAAGRFAVGNIEPGPVRVVAIAPGFWSIEPADFEVVAGEQVAGVLLVMHRGAVLEGRVLTAAGAPAPGARVAALAGDGEAGVVGWDRPAAVADRGGAYRLEGLPEGPRRIRAELVGFPPVTGQLEVRPEMNRLDLFLPGGAAVAGRVMDPSGLPISAAEVALRPAAGSGAEPPAAVTSDAGGAFAFAGIEAGRYQLVARRQGFTSTHQTVEVGDTPLEDLEVRLERGCAIHGQVLGLSAAEVSQAVAEASASDGSGQTARLGPGGSFRLDGLAAATWSVTVRVAESEREVRGAVTVMPGEDATLDLEFGSGLTLMGTVRRAGLAVEGAWVIVTGQEGSGATFTGAAGQFRIEGLRPGHYLLNVSHLAAGWQQTVDLAVDQLVEVELEH